MKNGAKTLEPKAGSSKFAEGIESLKLEPILKHINHEKQLSEAMARDYHSIDYVNFEKYKLLKETHKSSDEFYAIELDVEISDKNMENIYSLVFNCFNQTSGDYRRHQQRTQMKKTIDAGTESGL
jgi:hypothetical protein